MAKKIPVTVLATVLNEAKTIVQLLDGVYAQKYQPTEVIIVDGGSTDKTVQLMKAWHNRHSKFPLHIYRKKGNRSVGRNYGMSKSSTNLVAITDAGCVPHTEWLKHLVGEYQRSKAEVVAGYYAPKIATSLQEAIASYMLVVPSDVNEKEFLPATRSMLLHKKVWKTLGGFDETLITSEDYAFAHHIKKRGFRIAMSKKAVVWWYPIDNFSLLFNTMRDMAEFDVRGGVTRPKAMFVLVRYGALVLLSVQALRQSTDTLLWLWLLLGIPYFGWAIVKKYQYARSGWYWLPCIQLVADMAVGTGTIRGWWYRLMRRRK